MPGHKASGGARREKFAKVGGRMGMSERQCGHGAVRRMSNAVCGSSGAMGRLGHRDPVGGAG